MEEINPWMNGENFLRETDRGYQIAFYTEVVRSKMYDIDISGMDNRVTKLHLFDLVTVDESMVKEGIEFDKTDVEKNLTLFLYPDDSDEDGKKLRLFQQYFMVCNAAHFIIDEAKSRGSNIMDLPDYAVIQINDTHPSLIIPELIRQIMAEGIHMDEAINIVKKCCAYTNHTILAEALEKWPLFELQSVIPNIVPIIEELDRRIRTHVKDTSTYIIDDENLVHMANMDIHYGFSVNGVARLHEKFNNKTNGIVQRRWTQIADQPLSKTIDKWIGSGWRSDIHELRKLNDLVDNPEVLNDFYHVKQEAKARLAAYIKETTGIEVSTDAIFDVQVKRLHAYKRQLLNVLNIIKQYWDLKDNPDKDIVPHVYIFGAKAAPGYHFAKSVIKVINELANLINNDSSLNGKLKVVFLENYNVSLAELIIPAANVSEQISLASKEASGTSNMKFMMTGAITLATLDGANIEIKDEVGSDNIVIFGMDKDDVYRHYERHDYYSRSIYENNPIIRRVVDSFINGTIPNIQGEGTEIYESLITHNDEYFLLEDFTAYVEAQEKIDQLYRNQEQWMRMSLINIANSDKFTSDDTITQYAKEIWQLKN